MMFNSLSSNSTPLIPINILRFNSRMKYSHTIYNFMLTLCKFNHWQDEGALAGEFEFHDLLQFTRGVGTWVRPGPASAGPGPSPEVRR